MVEIVWLGHAAFLVRSKAYRLLIDPFNILDRAEVAQYKSEFTHPDVIFLTHGHGDHLLDAPAILKGSPATVLCCMHEIALYMEGQGSGAPKTLGVGIGSTVEVLPGLSVSPVRADHSSSLPDGSYGGAPLGFVIHVDGHHIYHTGDTALFSDMSLISRIYHPDIALMCIGGHYTMGPLEAAVAINEFLPSVKSVIPMHFGTFPPLKGTPEQLKQAIIRADVTVDTLAIGESKSYA